MAFPKRIVVSIPDRRLRSDYPEEYFAPLSEQFTEEESLQRAFPALKYLAAGL